MESQDFQDDMPMWGTATDMYADMRNDMQASEPIPALDNAGLKSVWKKIADFLNPKKAKSSVDIQ